MSIGSELYSNNEESANRSEVSKETTIDPSGKD